MIGGSVMQFLGGFVLFTLSPSSLNAIKAQSLPYHRIGGFVLYGLSLAAVFMGCFSVQQKVMHLSILSLERSVPTLLAIITLTIGATVAYAAIPRSGNSDQKGPRKSSKVE